MEIKYPDVTVVLTGTDGNAYAIMGAVKKALHESGKDQEIIDSWFNDAKSAKSYDELLQKAFQWVNVD